MVGNNWLLIAHWLLVFFCGGMLALTGSLCGGCRFLTRLLLVHGSLSAYRLSRLVKYSFYKNIAFGFMLFYYQFYCGFSGQSMVDDISAAAFNVIFTAVPILLFAVLDRPVRHLDTLLRYPQVCPLPSP
jgi:phospholipid-transporting ATPase